MVAISHLDEENTLLDRGDSPSAPSPYRRGRASRDAAWKEPSALVD